jgi:TPP-dependent pyruvate/acetoin dehydrogenase alpha subunit
MLGLEELAVVREVKFTSADLKQFEEDIAKEYENGSIKGPIHLSDGNEEELIKIFSYISSNDFVFSAWRNHYHALLHGVDQKYLSDEIREGRSMGIMSNQPNFFSSSIVGGIIPVALGTALAYSRHENTEKKVWCFIGDMTYESGLFWEAYKFSRYHNLPLNFIVEDNGKSVTTDTKVTWNSKMEVLDGVIWYSYKSKFPHHGTGKWVNF